MGNLAKAGLLVLVLVILLLGWNHRRLMRVYQVMTLFRPDVIVSNFRSMETISDTSPVRRGSSVYEFARDPQHLPTTYRS